MAALEDETNVISTSSGRTVQFVAISTISNRFTLPKLGSMSNSFKVMDDPEEFAKLINDKLKAIYFESMRNPKFNIPDFEAIGKIAHDAGIPFIAENICYR
ncbi:hypothetical protein RhiirA4_471382 [Rhizophagus irregularis]|uniref:Uncharacterized protein n=1 Tax=Rhizophagus irregularis TaxID=588596 RepID=A0A2I1H301_9GLOM|nr:hypothetical protein RhiirA4_471382 [Rhizophagus irregularis]